jgi:hypothetical protein
MSLLKFECCYIVTSDESVYTLAGAQMPTAQMSCARTLLQRALPAATWLSTALILLFHLTTHH